MSTESHPPIRIKINCSKIEKARLFKGEKGVYLDATLVYKPNDFGDDYFITQDVTKEEREKGIKGPILGNGKRIVRKAAAPTRAPAPTPENEEDVPF